MTRKDDTSGWRRHSLTSVRHGSPLTPTSDSPHTHAPKAHNRSCGPTPITLTERRAMDTTNHSASPAEELTQHRGHEIRRLTDDVATVPMPAEAAGTKEIPHPITHGGLRGWAARRPVLSFMVLLFTIAYPVMSLPVLAAHGVIPDGWMPRLPGLNTERIAAAMLVFLALLPTTFLVTWAAEGRPGVLRLVRRMVRFRIGARWWLIVIVGLPTLTMALALLLGDHLTPVDVLPFAITQTLGFLVNLLLINLWEETAWAGFVQTRLERRHSLPIAAVLTAVPFALIHMPLHFIGDFSPESLATALVPCSSSACWCGYCSESSFAGLGTAFSRSRWCTPSSTAATTTKELSPDSSRVRPTDWRDCSP